jgi:hypothetical protein
MIPDGEYTAVVDRVEDGLATLEVTVDGGPHELVVPEAEVPATAARADTVCQVTIEDDTLVDVVPDADETATRLADAQRRFDRLSGQSADDESTDQ